MSDKRTLLSQPIQHIDIARHNVVPLVEAMRGMAYSARDLARAAEIYDRMLRDQECGIILCLAGSLISAGLKKIVVDMIRSRMIDAIVSTGANIVDQDFFEGLGFKHYVAPERFKAGMDDDMLRGLQIDRIYDTLIDEDELRVCDDTTRQIADELPPRPHSSREFIQAMGAWLDAHRGLSPSPRQPIAIRSYWPPSSTICPSFARRSPIARRASGWSPISMLAATGRKFRSTA